MNLHRLFQVCIETSAVLSHIKKKIEWKCKKIFLKKLIYTIMENKIKKKNFNLGKPYVEGKISKFKI